MSLRETIVAQFEHPRGVLGHIVGWILAARGSNLRRIRWTVDLLDPTDGERVLEIGCGPGVGLQACLERPGVAVVGVDHSALMVAQATKRNRAAVDAGRLTLVHGTVDSVPSALAPFDKAFSINVIQFVERPAFIAQLEGALKPGGLLATTYQPRHAKATRADALEMAAQLTELLAAQGFAAMRTEEIDLKPVPAVCVLAHKAG
jgi:cyclopropane fatty-acyl-phospholipid synthase-like methyltransferase